MFQRTIEKPAAIEGIGLHSGQTQKVELLPAKANAGIIFNDERLSIESVCAVSGFTRTRKLMTIEHLLSALWGLFIDNVDICSKDDEVPILDGSSLPIINLLCPLELDTPRRYIRVLKPVWFEDDSASVRLLPSEQRIFDVEIDYPDTPAIGNQHERLELTEETYRVRIAPARSFARMSDVEFFRTHGKALGASLDTGIGVDGDKILNPENLRDPHEFVLHKISDAIGDMATAGIPLLAEYRV